MEPGKWELGDTQLHIYHYWRYWSCWMSLSSMTGRVASQLATSIALSTAPTRRALPHPQPAIFLPCHHHHQPGSTAQPSADSASGMRRAQLASPPLRHCPAPQPSRILWVIRHTADWQALQGTAQGLHMSLWSHPVSVHKHEATPTNVQTKTQRCWLWSCG
jgi:hypothetical protein